MIIEETFRGRTIRMRKGSMHPEYSVDCFAEERQIRDDFWLVRPGDQVVDVGASYGAYTLTALAMGAEVRAFEPEPSVCADLATNVELNGWTKLTLHPIALSDRKASIDMREYAPHWPQGTITGKYDACDLDAYGLTALDWLKVDVEGHEEAVLRGALKTIQAHKPFLLIECHDFLDPHISARVEAMLAPYTFVRIERDPCTILFGSAR